MLAGMLGTIAFSAANFLYDGSALSRIRIGVVLPDEDELAEKVMALVGEMDSVESVCDLIYVDEEEGRNRTAEGQLDALLVIPSEMIEGIINGTNTPALVVFPKSRGLEAAAFRELADSGARILGTAQAAIYAADNFCVNYGMESRIYEVNAALNRIFLSYSLPRREYFKDYQVSATGMVTPFVFFGISGFLLYLMLCGIPAAMIVKRPSGILSLKLKAMGVGRVKQTASSVICVLALLLCAAVPAVWAAWLGGLTAGGWQTAAVTFLVCFLCSSMIVFFYELARSRMAGVMGIFVVSVAMMFAAGGIIPSVFLPEGMEALSEYLPVKWMMDAVALGMTGEAPLSLLWKLFAAAFLCCAGTALVRRDVG